MHFGRRIGIQSPLLDMTDDADDLALHFYWLEIDTLPDGILRWERLTLKFLINDSDTGAILIVVRGDETAAEKRNSHDVQVVGTDPIEQSHVHLTLLGRFRTAFHPIRHFGVTTHRHGAHQNADRTHTRNGPQLIDGSLVPIADCAGRAMYSR